MPTQLIHGERVGKQGRIKFGVSATVFDEKRERVLLTRRSDNALWSLPGGAMEPGESAAEACIREVKEETGLCVQVRRLVGIYSSPDWLIEYPDGKRVQIVAVNFEVEVESGCLKETDECSQFGYYTLEECQKMDLAQDHLPRITDAFNCQGEAFIR